MVAFEIGDVVIYETSNCGSAQMKIVNVGGDGRLDLECEKGGKKNKADPERCSLVEAEIPASKRRSVAELQEGIPVRERGTADDDLNNYIVETLKSLGGTTGLLRKWTDSWDTPEKQSDLGSQILASFPKAPRAGINFAVFDAIPAAMETGASVEGHLNPVSFCYTKAAYEDFDVYETDFITTVKDIATHGYSGVLKVRPICGNLASTSKRFMWGPDGEYASSVELMGIQFLVFIDVLDQKRLPSWLTDNLSTVRAVHTVHGPVSRGIALFRQTIKSNNELY